jgi:hypothetical protein
MAARVTADGVREIMPGMDLEDGPIDAYIATANLIITNTFSGADVLPNDATLAEMERYYAAHMVASTSWRLPAREKVGDAEIEYGQKVEYVGEGYERLASTFYGQTVLQLDPTGRMNSIGKRKARLLAIESFD